MDIIVVTGAMAREGEGGEGKKPRLKWREKVVV